MTECPVCHKVGFHKMSCSTQKVTVFNSEVHKESGQKLTKPSKKSTNKLT